MTGPRTLFLRILLVLALVAAVDVILSLTWLSEGRVGKRPLPPFGIEFDEPQLAVLARLEAGLVNQNSVVGFDRDLGWCVRPLAAHPTQPIRINSRGLRGEREYSELPPPDKLRVACYGDSFAFGDEVGDEATYESFLERIQPSVEALNFGVSAYGTDQALLRMERDGILGARAVIVSLLLENIGRNVNRYRPLWTARTLSPLAKPRFVLVNDQLQLIPQPFADGREFAQAARSGAALEILAEHEYWRGRPELWTGRASSLGRLAAGWFAYRERDPQRLWLDRDGEPFRVTVALIEALRERARALGAKEFLVLLFPMREELADYRESGKAYWSAVADEFTSRGIDCIDLAPALAAEDLRCEQDPLHPTLFVAAHLSSVGNQTVAVEIQRWLLDRRLLAHEDVERR